MLEEVQLKLEEVKIPFVVEETNDEIDEHIIDTNLEEVDENEYWRKSLIERFWLSNEKNFAEEDKYFIDKNLKNISINKLLYLSEYSFKSVKTALLFSIFLGGLGIDRFYVGDTALGICKLFFNAMTLGIWSLVDIFLIMNITRKKNIVFFKNCMTKY